MAEQKVKPSQQLAIAGAGGNSAVLSGNIPMAGDLAVVTLPSFTLAVQSKVLINANVEMLLTANQEFYAAILDNGITLISVSNNSSNNDLLRFKHITTVPTLNAGAHVLTLLCRAWNGGAGTYNSPAYGNTLSYMVAGAA